MSANTNQPDWAQMAQKFDLFLPAIAPVGEALLDALDARAGDQILDVASGTGEPALTLARQLDDRAEILGTDAAEPMVAVANDKARQLGLQHIHFETMAAEKLALPDNAYDRVLSRFGVMLFADSQQGLNEMCRVMKPGGRVALAVWGEDMPVMRWNYEIFKDRIPEDRYPPLEKITSMGSTETLSAHMTTAGFTQIEIVVRRFNYSFPSFDAYWDAVEFSGLLQQQLDALPADQHALLRDEARHMAVEFDQTGGFHVPHDYLLAVASKSPT